jgi:hypothetical protein
MIHQTTRISDTQPPDLRILPIGKLLPHELHEDQRSGPLIQKLQHDNVLKNPPIVTPAGPRDDRFVILDGANRVVALDVLGIGYVLVQVVPYELPHVRLETWYHLLTGLTVTEASILLNNLAGIEVTVSDIFHAQAALAARRVLAYYVLADNHVCTLSGGGLDIRERTHLLRTIVESYVNRTEYHRVVSGNLHELRRLYPELAMLVVFPHYEPVEIIDLALAGLRVPPGITRHAINGRALRVNYPLDDLAAPDPIEEKNEKLHQWLSDRFKQRRVRYYAEATYLFDE